MFRFRYIFFFLVFLTRVQAQQAVEFDSIAETLIVSGKQDFKLIDKTLRKYKRDTVYMKRFLAKCKDELYPYGEIYAYNMLGRVYRNKSQYNLAEQAHKKSYELAKEYNFPLSQVYSLNMLGVVYRRQDAVKMALDYHFQALDLANTLDKTNRDVLKNIAISENSIANIFNLLQKYDLASEHYSKALAIEEKRHNKLGMAINYQNIGSVKESEGKLDEALSYYNKSLALNKAINSKVGLIICSNSIGSVYIEQNRIQEAIDLMLPAIKISEEVDDNFYKAMAYISVGKAYAEKNDYKKASNYLNKGLKISLDNNLLSAIAQAYGYLSELEERSGHYKQSLAYIKKYGEYENKILNTKDQKYVNDLLIKLKNKEKIAQIKVLDAENQAVKDKLNKTKRQVYFGLSLLILLSILGVIFYYQNKLNTHRKYIDLKQNLMRTQMNPHFIFNALNSIKLYIINNEKEQAVYYLNKFSKLIRTILVSSRQKEITLKEELNNSKLYAQIENIRFENAINFSIEVPETIAVDTIKIPPLVLQPFLENAFWHGLALKAGEKKLHIQLLDNKTAGYVEIQITDNGIGRTKAMEHKKQRVHNKKSIGIQLTKERLKEFTKSFKKDYPIEIVDLHDDKGNASGTQIVLKIPYSTSS